MRNASRNVRISPSQSFLNRGGFMPDPPELMELDELEVSCDWELQEAISSLKFYANLAKHKNQSIKMVIFGVPSIINKVKPLVHRKG